MNNPNLISEIEKYISFLKKLSEEEVNSLFRKETEISFQLKKKQNASKNMESSVNNEKIDGIILALNSITDRLEGEKYLKSLQLNRLNLEIILKKLDIPFQKKDSISKLYDKITESTIGYKLRSQAIQNNNSENKNVTMG